MSFNVKLINLLIKGLFVFLNEPYPYLNKEIFHDLFVVKMCDLQQIGKVLT